MIKHSIYLLVAVATTALAGCQLYFGEGDDHGEGGSGYGYCGQDGYYECDGEDCYWQGSECPQGMEPGQPPGGFDCKVDTDCAAGCYCSNGVCEEAGFCASDADCGNGFTCDEQRSSCEPTNQPTSCLDDNGCPSGQYCDNGTCTASCTCASDADAVNGGYGYCDENRGTCMVGADPNGECSGAITCNFGRPSCPEGQVALIADGCYTGQCAAIASCGTAPSCNAYGYESDCRADTSCGVSYTGLNCKKPDNSPCTAGSTDCTCASYVFAACSDNGSPRTVEYNGHTYDASVFNLK